VTINTTILVSNIFIIETTSTTCFNQCLPSSGGYYVRNKTLNLMHFSVLLKNLAQFSVIYTDTLFMKNDSCIDDVHLGWLAGWLSGTCIRVIFHFSYQIILFTVHTSMDIVECLSTQRSPAWTANKAVCVVQVAHGLASLPCSCNLFPTCVADTCKGTVYISISVRTHYQCVGTQMTQKFKSSDCWLLQ
jgi:hypothetical protein